MSKMTYERWMQIDRLQWEKARRENPSVDIADLRRALTKAMVATHGPCPPKPKEPKPPWWGRIVIRLLRPKLEKALEEKMNGKASPLPKWALALIWGVGGAVVAAQVALGDGSISGGEITGIITAFIGAGWAKFTNPEKAFSHKPTVK